jgi:N,N'-diacetyllegionaminate synthase
MPKTTIIADVSSNHMGDINLAKTMIEIAAKAGVDTVKFQSWKADSLRKDFPDYEATYARHRKTQLSDEDHKTLIDHCRAKGVEFLTTCFDLSRVDFLASLGLKRIKVASPDCGSERLLKALMKKFPSLIVSTGMTPEEDVRKAVEITRGHDVVFLHCVSLYPTPLDKANLRRMDWLKNMGVRVGLSDHSLGTQASKVAIARGAEIIEKHYTLSRQLPGKDQAMSMQPDEFAELCKFRDEVALMEGVETPPLSEEEQRLRGIYVGKWGNNR